MNVSNFLCIHKVALYLLSATTFRIELELSRKCWYVAIFNLSPLLFKYFLE